MKDNLQSRGWMITAFDLDKWTRETLTEALEGFTVRGQLEAAATTGRRHWQIWAEKPSATRFGTMRKRLPGCHLEPRKGTKQQAFAYVMKEETRVPGVPPIEIGALDLGEEKKESDLDRWHRLITAGEARFEDIILRESKAYRHSKNLRSLQAVYDAKTLSLNDRELEVTAIWGPPGVGKTRLAMASAPRDQIFRVTDYKRDPFQGYSGQDVLVLDEFRGEKDLPLSQLNTYLDRYPVQLSARYFSPYAQFTKVFVLSNFAPETWYPGEGIGPTLPETLARRIHHLYNMQEGGVLGPDLHEYRASCR